MSPWAIHLCCLLAVAAATKCAAPGADCSTSECCTNTDMTCFEKNPYWASCKTTCKPGIDPNDPPEYQDPWSCKPLGTPPTAPPRPEPVDPPSDGSPHLTYMSGNLGKAKTTRYWDCCKPSCAWPDKARVSEPVKVCDKNGLDQLGSGSKNVCGGGGSGGPSYMCASQQPWNDKEKKLSFGYAAGVVRDVKESGSCCACYELRFEGGKIPNMVVQVGNTGADLDASSGGHFDIQVPGGGFGIFDGCTKQFNLPSKNSWGARYGGIMTAGWGKDGCKKLPKFLRNGCDFTFDFLGDNPKVSSFYRVVCPADIVKKSGCKREDDAPEGGSPSPRRRRAPPRRRRDPSRRRLKTSSRRRRTKSRRRTKTRRRRKSTRRRRRRKR